MVYSLKKFAYIKIGENMANNIREIITQAVIAKGKKRTLNKYPFVIENYDKILGCWITNHRYSATFQNGQPVVLGTFDVHIWYSNNDDSSVLKQTVSYVNDLDLVRKDSRDFNENDELVVTCNREPKCIGVNKSKDDIIIEIEKEISLSVIGKTTMRVETKVENESWDELDNITVDEKFIK